MLVKLERNWFSPTNVIIKDKIQSISGRRWKAGVVHEMPDELKDHLPKGAEILDKIPEPEPEPEQTASLKDFDIGRASGELATEKVEEAEARILKKKRQDQMAKARAAKGAKKGNKTVE